MRLYFSSLVREGKKVDAAMMIAQFVAVAG